MYALLQEELQGGNITRLKKLLESNKKSVDNLMKVLMAGKGSDLILEKLDGLEKERKEIQAQIAIEKSEVLDFSLSDIRKFVKRFKHLMTRF